MDQLGAILSGWWIMTDDGVPTAAEALAGVVAISEFVTTAAEVADQSAGRLVVEHFARSRLEGDRSSEKWPVAELALRAWRTAQDPDTGEPLAAGAEQQSWQEKLKSHGIRAVCAYEVRDARGNMVPRGGPGEVSGWHTLDPPVVKMFEGTAWAGQKWRFLLRSSCRGSKRHILGPDSRRRAQRPRPPSGSLRAVLLGWRLEQHRMSVAMLRFCL